MREVAKSADSGRLRVEREGVVATLVFDNPNRRNAMTLAMWEDLARVAERFVGDTGVRVVVLRGAGERAFVSGADISEFQDLRDGAAQAERYGHAVARAEAAVGALPQPTVALIQGYCIGGGVGIALRADLRVANDTAEFALTPARLGLGYPAEDVAALHRLVGPAFTADMLYTARRVPAEEALARGLCQRVIPASGFDREAGDLIASIAAHAPLTLRAVKATLRDLARPEAERDPAATAALVAACFDSADYREGQAAFTQKRAPRFEGR
ncbi:MAG: enoyl-CoA hydratase [Pseudomonadota bacterium]